MRRRRFIGVYRGLRKSMCRGSWGWSFLDPRLEHRAEKWIRFSGHTMLLSKKEASDPTPKVQVHFWVRCFSVKRGFSPALRLGQPIRSLGQAQRGGELKAGTEIKAPTLKMGSVWRRRECAHISH